MGVRLLAAEAIGAVLTAGLRGVLHRPAANTPGKIALYANPYLIADLRARLTCGSAIVAGTNGKTSTTNLIADALEVAGITVACNRTGANLDSGVATTLLQTKSADWGIFESDELWMAKILPGLQSNYVLLLNLFRDQLDRCGEIERIQESIAGSLATSPHTTLIYNADDPLCAAIAAAITNPTITFGIQQDLKLAQNTVTDAQMCQICDGMVDYTFRQYGQLGDYHCPTCGFARPKLDYAASSVELGADGATFTITRPDNTLAYLHTKQASPYVIYNLLAAFTLLDCLGVSAETLQTAIDAFNPRNGRLQKYRIGQQRVLLNLAKNPTGFNQNLKIVEQDANPKAVAFFINDKEADGHDISWLWDVDFEELAGDANCKVFAGGIRKNDLQVRLKYADIASTLIDDIADVFGYLDSAPSCNDVTASTTSDGDVATSPVCDDVSVISTSNNVATSHPAQQPPAIYAIANYTALPAVKASLDAMERVGAPMPTAHRHNMPEHLVHNLKSPSQTVLQRNTPLVIAHLFPDLLNLYGDGGNVRILEMRARWHGIPVEVKRVHYGDTIDLSGVDLLFLGGAPDREQKLASGKIMGMRDDIARFVEDDGVVLAICGGYQMLGRTWLLDGEEVEGLSIIDMETRRPGTSADRLINNIVLQSPLATHPVVGYENHAGRTYLGESATPFGTVVSRTGAGNNDDDKADGVRYRNVLGTYLHGPLLAKNPEIADWLLSRALEHRAARLEKTNAWASAQTIDMLNDAEELAANAYMCKKLGA